MKFVAFILFCLALASAAHAEPLRVMSFNVRYPSKDDGANVWENRRDLLVRTILDADPDVFGTQELFHLQGEYIVEKALAYAWFGVGRRGDHEDEHMGIFYKKTKLRVIESGNFWLSETPDVVGSSAWDMSLPRMVTWALFEHIADGRRFYFYNTHFAHRGEDGRARLESAKVIAKRLGSLPADVPVIVTGDFNTSADSDVHQKMLEPRLHDAWKTAAKQSGPDGTFHGWNNRNDGRRIDWILYRSMPKPLEAATVTYNEDKRYPSDHYPVLAVFDF